MVKPLAVACAILCWSMLALGQPAAASRPAATRPITRVTPLAPRTEIPLADWRFFKGPLVDWVAAAADDSGWEAVHVPHTWNAVDGADGGNDYYRGEAWYRRHLVVTPDMEGKTLYLRFQGANRRTDAFMNGQPVGSHTGGFGAFCFDITAAAKLGDNVITVRVSNADDRDSPPLSADFTFFGGLYRAVELVAVPPVHLSPLDYGSSGVYVDTAQVSAQSATVQVRVVVRHAPQVIPAPPPPAATRPAARVSSRGPGPRATPPPPRTRPGATMAAARFPPGTESVLAHIRILDALGRAVADSFVPLAVMADSSGEVLAAYTINRPHLWDGRRDPYLYHVVVTLVQTGRVLDEVTQPLGIRTFSVDPAKGFMLNGRPYDLHGVNRHQDRAGEGWAISRADEEQDMALIKEMGCTAVRLAHYQQSDSFYSLCDQAGLVVWAELPLVNDVTLDEPFAQNAHDQLMELIRQSRNHPSICFWSLGNELGRRHDPTALLRGLNAAAHGEDASRLTTMAFAAGTRWAGITDLTGENRYFGWYGGSIADFAPWLAQQPPLMAVSEYGAGASIHFHAEKPVIMDHTEEYQCLFHEAYWGALKNSPQIWGKFVWAMFDFASDGRAEGDHAGINDKGLVTYDRKTRKDAFYFYKANWSEEPVVWIAGKRFAVRGVERIAVKVYANLPQVMLLVNGVSLGAKAPVNGMVVWEGVALKAGENRVEASGMAAATKPGGVGKAASDSCVWTYTAGAPAAVFEGQDEVMRAALKVGPPRAR